jgi:hypothetical protein
MPGQGFKVLAVSRLVDFHHFREGAAPVGLEADERGIAMAVGAECAPHTFSLAPGVHKTHLALVNSCNTPALRNVQPVYE